MAYEIGPKIGMDGEAEFRKELRGVIESVKTLGAEMNAVTAAFEGNENSAEALAAKQELLEDVLQEQTKKVELLNRAVEEAKNVYGEADTKTLQWQRSLYNATAELEKTKHQIERTKEEAAALTAIVPIDPFETFKKQLDQTSQNIKLLGAETKFLTAKYADAETEVQALSEKSDLLRKTMAQQEDQVAILEEALKEAALQYSEDEEATKQWEIALYNAKAELEKTRSSLNKTETALGEVGEEVENAGDDFNEAGDSAGRFGDILKANVLSDAIRSGVSALGSAIGNLVAGFLNLDEATEEYRRAQGKVDTAFEAAGHSAQAADKAYQGFYAVLGDTDTAAEASQLLARLVQSEQDVEKWTTIAAGAAGTFGDALPIEGLIEAANETAKTGKLTGQLADALNWVGISEEKFQEQLDGMTSEADRNALIMNTLSAAYDGAAQSFYNTNATLVQTRQNQALVDESMAQLGQSVAQVKTNILSGLLPSLNQLTSGLAGVLSGEQTVGQFLDTVGSMVGEIGSKIAQGLPKVKEAALGMVQSLAEGIRENLPVLIGEAANAQASFLSSITEGLPAIWQAGSDLLNSLVTGILDSIPAMAENLPQVISAFVGFVLENLKQIRETGMELLTNFVAGIIRNIPSLVSKIPEVIYAFVSTIGEYLPDVVSSGFDLLIQFGEGILGAISEIDLETVVEAILQGLGMAIAGAAMIGMDIIEGLWEGIASMGAWIGEKLRGFGEDVLSEIKDFFGIASPSKVFASLGGYMAEGLGLGFEKKMAGVAEQMEHAVPQPSLSLGDVAAGMVNGVQTALAGFAPTQQATIILKMGDGRELARWLLPDLRAVMRSTPEVV